MPKVGRPPYHDPAELLRRADPDAFHHSEPRDIRAFREWQQSAVAVFESLPANDFECLACAQHHGLATRLLDWTTNPLTALYFAVETELGRPGGVFVYSNIIHVESQRPLLDQPQLAPVNQVGLYYPRPVDRRILCQSGVFTYHMEPHIPLEPQKDITLTIVVPSGMKDGIRRWLDSIGVSRKSLFPDLDGLSSYLNWWYSLPPGGPKTSPSPTALHP